MELFRGVLVGARSQLTAGKPASQRGGLPQESVVANSARVHIYRRKCLANCKWLHHTGRLVKMQAPASVKIMIALVELYKSLEIIPAF